MVDDTTTKIFEKTPIDRRSDVGEEEEGGSSELLTPLAPRESLMAAITSGLGLPSLGTTAEGKRAAVTVIHGFDGQNDHASRITLFLSHRGQAGNLLDILLANRTEDLPLTLVSDMLAANFPSGATRERTRLVSAACAAHARRRFFALRELDDEMWLFIRGFMILADIETYAKENERRPREVLRIRRLHAGRVWRILKAQAERFQSQSGWEPSLAPNKACSYLLKHYEALTRYLNDPNLPWTNNLCERALHREKIMLVEAQSRSPRLIQALQETAESWSPPSSQARFSRHENSRIREVRTLTYLRAVVRSLHNNGPPLTPWEYSQIAGPPRKGDASELKTRDSSGTTGK